MHWNDLRHCTLYSNISFSPAMCTLHYAQSVFEGLKAYKRADGGVYLFRAEDNFKRMNISADRMCMAEIRERSVHEWLD